MKECQNCYFFKPKPLSSAPLAVDVHSGVCVVRPPTVVQIHSGTMTAYPAPYRSGVQEPWCGEYKPKEKS